MRDLLKKCLRVFSVAIIGVGFLVNMMVVNVLAALPAFPESYVTYTANNSYVFVMLSPERDNSDDSSTTIIVAGKSWLIKDYFPVSGLYKISSRTPEWKVSWFSSDCAISSDGQYVVRCNTYGYRNSVNQVSETWGIKVYEKNKELASHEASCFLNLPDVILPYEPGFGIDPWIDQENEDWLKIKKKILTIHTTQGDTYQIDVTSGKTISHWSTVLFGMRILGVVCLVFFIWTGYLKYCRAIRFFQKNNQAAKKRMN